MVLHKLVNSTNVVFHMLDLQPYAMVLPMDKVTSEKNKKKILSKIYRNNPDTYASYKLYLRDLNQKKTLKKNADVQKDASEASELSQNLKMEQLENQNDNKSTPNMESSPVPEVQMADTNNADIKSEYNTPDPDLNPKSSHNTETDSSNQNYQVGHTDQSAQDTNFSKESDLTSLKKSENRSLLDYQDESEEDMFSGVRRFIDRLDSENIIGCMIILASKSSDKSSISPVAGGIVEVFDDYERSIQTVWINHNIGNYVKFNNLKGKNAKKLINTLNDQILSKVVLSTLTFRLCAHAYQMTLPNSKRTQHKSRLISIYHQMGQTFPKFAYSFIKEEMQFSKHYEITALSIKHNDNPKIPCRCLKPTPSELSDAVDPGTILENSPLFFGITESRFSGMYNSTYEPILIGFMNLLSGKLNDISKIMRFEDSVNYYEEDDDLKAKRQKLNYRSRRLQNKM